MLHVMYIAKFKSSLFLMLAHFEGFCTFVDSLSSVVPLAFHVVGSIKLF